MNSNQESALLVGLPAKTMSAITTGRQTWLFKRRPPKQEYSRIVFSTLEPNPLVLAEALPVTTVEGSPLELYHAAHGGHVMSNEQWHTYWRGCEHGAAIKFSQVYVFADADRYNPLDRFKVKAVPQNFAYVLVRHPLGAPQWRDVYNGD